jgi:hypothetical protein
MSYHPFFNAHHSPIGAFASFTLGFPGAKGGLGLELGKPADQNVYIGVENESGALECLPFFAGSEDERARYEVEQSAKAKGKAPVTAFARDAIRRDFRLCTDTWTAGDLTFRVISPVMSVPDPAKASKAALAFALCPAVLAELTLDNTKGTRARRAFIGYQGTDPYSNMRRLDDVARGKYVGVGQGLRTAIACRDRGVVSGLGFSVDEVVAPKLEANRVFGLGAVGALAGTAPAGVKATFRFAICFHRAGPVTTGIPTTYFYTRYFKSIEDVALYALKHFGDYVKAAEKANRLVDDARLSDDQKFQLRHTIRSYYGSTELLDWKRKPFWVVNEGEYRMMNTFDLTVDQLFYEMRLNPWTVRNELDGFADRYSYTDKVHFPGGENAYPGGLSFTHDMGVGNAVSRPGFSSYEIFGLDGCFSHMTHEQLVNWILCAAVYVQGTRDRRWLRKRLPVLESCLQSLLRRDHPDPAKRTGVMKLDSSRTLGGAEITTYDSLDQSLGQSRNNLYMAVKTWAAYVALERIFGDTRRPRLAATAADQARRCAATLVSKVRPGGYIPAVIDENNDSRIIPAVEGLAFPLFTGREDALRADGPYAEFLAVLRRHLEAVLVPGQCLFADGAWKLSSTSDNSWLSKIALCQFVARKVLGLPWNEKGRRADAAHVAWLLNPELSYWSWSDQIVAGKISGSRYYPRGVTSILWLLE